jgi:hypothetical protein
MPGQQADSQQGVPQPDDALLHKQLGYYQSWLLSLSQAPLQAVALGTVQSAVRVVVSGFTDTTTAEVGFAHD